MGIRFLLGGPIYLAISHRICGRRVEGNEIFSEVKFLNVQFFSEKGNPLIKSWGKSSQKRTCAFQFAKNLPLCRFRIKTFIDINEYFSVIPDLRTKLCT